jgi:hypothetical protein
VKMREHDSLILLVRNKKTVTYAAETWTVTNKTEIMLMTWERKLLRKKIWTNKENGQWRIKTNL